MTKIYSSFLLLLITSLCFAQGGINLQKVDNGKRTTFIPNGTKITVHLLNGAKIKGQLTDEDAYTMLISYGTKSTIVNYSSVQRIATYKETDYFVLTGDMLESMGDLGSANCGNSCTGPVAPRAFVIVAGVFVGVAATELIVESTADLVNDNYYSMDKWKFTSANY